MDIHTVGQLVLGLLLTLIAFVLNGVRASLNALTLDLKTLNDKVLTDYATKETVDKLMSELRLTSDSVLQNYVTRDTLESRNKHLGERIEIMRRDAMRASVAIEILAMKAGIELPRTSA